MNASKAKAHRKTKVIVVINQKGGQGKTSVSFNLAHAAAAKSEDANVLCLDLDSQGNLSQCLADDLEVIKRTQGGVGDLFDGIAPSPEPTIHPRIKLLHGHKELDRYDKDGEAEERAYSPEMSAKLRGLGFDVIIIDTPPAVGLRQLAPLMWADLAVIPLEPTIFGITGFQEVLSVIDKDIRPINPSLQWAGVINRVNMRVRAHREKNDWVRATYGDNILATLSARTAVADAMEESPARPVWAHRGAPRELREQWLACCTAVVDL